MAMDLISPIYVLGKIDRPKKLNYTHKWRIKQSIKCIGLMKIKLSSKTAQNLFGTFRER